MIYLDYTANTPPSAPALASFAAAEMKYYGNANAAHAFGARTKDMISRETEKTASLLSVSPKEIIYTSGATEANNLAVKGIAYGFRQLGKHILSTQLEHSSVGASLTELQSAGFEVDLVPSGKDGRIDLDAFRDLLRSDTILVSVSAVDSELGVLQPVREIAEILKDYPNAHLHIDAVQAVGKTPVDFTLGDTVSFAPHKFYGLNGVGVLIKREGLVLHPQIQGGLSTTEYRSGTPAPGLIASVYPALSEALAEEEARVQKVTELNRYLRNRLQEIPDVLINSPADALPHILNLSIRGIHGQDMQQALSDRGVMVSVNSACSARGMISRSVFAVTHDRKRSLETIRVSLSHLTTMEEAEAFVEKLRECIESLKKESS